jgi:hypothetical protein
MEDNYEEEEYVESDNESEAEDVVRAPTIKLRLKTQPEETEKPNLEKDIFESDEDEDIDDSVVDDDNEESKRFDLNLSTPESAVWSLCVTRNDKHLFLGKSNGLLNVFDLTAQGKLYLN